MSTPQEPTGLRAWGKSLWEQVTSSYQFDAAGYFILAEACRTADIIEQLAGALRSNSREWIRLADDAEFKVDAHGEQYASIKIVVDSMLIEIRQQRLAMRQLLAQLKLGKTEDGTAEGSDVDKLMSDFNMPD